MNPYPNNPSSETLRSVLRARFRGFFIFYTCDSFIHNFNHSRTMNSFDVGESSFATIQPYNLRILQPITYDELRKALRVRYCVPDWQLLSQNLFRLPVPVLEHQQYYVLTYSSWIYRVTVAFNRAIQIETVKPGKQRCCTHSRWVVELD